jgi:hypothetical protein
MKNIDIGHRIANTRKLLAAQKPLKRFSRASRGRSRADLMELHKSFAGGERQLSSDRVKWIKGTLFAFTATVGYFLMGYLIAALSIGTWAKIPILIFVAGLGLVLSHFVTASFH